MSDKMLMEGWREFLTEEEVLDEALRIPSMKELEAFYSQLKRDLNLKVVQKVRSEGGQKETESDYKILDLRKKSPFWNEIFTLNDYKYAVAKEEDEEEIHDEFVRQTTRYRPGPEPGFDRWGDPVRIDEGFFGMGPWKRAEIISKGPPPRTTAEEIIKHYLGEGELKGGDQAGWEELVFFLNTCWTSNRDEDWKQVLENAAFIFGEGKGDNLLLKMGWALGLTALAGPLAALGTGWAILSVIGGLVPMVAGFVDSAVTEADWKEDFGPGLRKAFKDRPEIIEHHSFEEIMDDFNYNEQIALKLIAITHQVEYEMLTKLVAAPLQYPAIDGKSIDSLFETELNNFKKRVKETLMSRILAFFDGDDGASEEEEDVSQHLEDEEELKKFDPLGSVFESKFHDNWRNFLLTEEKK